MSLWSEVRERFTALVFRGRAEREMAEEMQFHLEMAGRPAFGDLERYKEDARDARGTRLIEETIADVGWSVRALIKRPRFAAVAIATLALGIGGTTAVFSVVDAVVLQPLPYQRPEQLVRVYTWFGMPGGRSFMSTFHFKAYRDHMAAFQSAAAIANYDAKGADIDLGNGAERITLLPVSAEYFATIGALPSRGRAFDRRQENGAPVAIVSDEFWRRRLDADPKAVGRALILNGVPYTIVGVGPRGVRDPLVGHVDAWIPIDIAETGNPDNHWLSMIARLQPGTSVAQAQAEMDALTQSLNAQFPEAKRNQGHLVPLKTDMVGSVSPALEAVLGAVGLVLLLVCVNVANLLLVRASERQPELALRTALGAGRGRIVRQLLIESGTLALCGGAAGLGVAWLAMRALVRLGSASIPRLEHLSLDARMLALALVIASLSAIVFGLAPALRAARTAETRGATGTASTAQRSLRAGLVVVQVGLAFVLLAGTGLLLASLVRLRGVPLGVQPDHVLTFRVELPDAMFDSTARARFYETLAHRLAEVPGVHAAGGVSRLPATGMFHQWGVKLLSGPRAGDDFTEEAQNRVVSGDYFAAMHIPLIAGRTFDERDQPAASRNVVIDQTAAQRLFPGIDPLGQQLTEGSTNLVVIGVVGDVSLDASGRRDATIYHSHRQFAGDRNWVLTQVVLTDGAPMDMLPDARRVLAALDPRLVADQPMTLDEVIGRGTAQRVFTLRILASFAAVALALAAVGLFGVLSYIVTLRQREIGIRMALGANRGAIRGMVLRQGVALTGLGIASGLVGAMALSRLIASLLFNTSPLDPRVLSAAVVFMLLVAAAAAYFPARRATTVDPRTALQTS